MLFAFRVRTRAALENDSSVSNQEQAILREKFHGFHEDPSFNVSSNGDEFKHSYSVVHGCDILYDNRSLIEPSYELMCTLIEL